MMMMRGADQSLKKSKGTEVAQSKEKRNCGKCGVIGHSIRTCAEMKAGWICRFVDRPCWWMRAACYDEQRR
jgi:hypothetical protein